MLMRRLLSILAVLAMISVAGAQIVITENTVMPIGTQWTSHSMLDFVAVDVGAAGANQTWTFGEYTFDFEGVGVVVDPSGTPYADSYPTANCAIEGDGGANYTYYRNTADAIYWLGLAAQGEANVFETEACLLPFPCTYGSAWTMVCYYEVVFGEEDVWAITDSILTEVDGWGTCQTPYGTEQVLRMFSHAFIRTELNGEPLSESAFLTYIWRPIGGLDYVIITSNEGETDPNFTMGDVEMASDVQSAPPPRGPLAESFVLNQNYPNPFNPSTTLPIELSKQARVTLSIYDETGRLVSQETHELSAGLQQLNVNGSAWATGTYFARVAAGSEQQTVKMQLVK